MIVDRPSEMSLSLCHYKEAHENTMSVDGIDQSPKYCHPTANIISTDVLQIVPNIFLSAKSIDYWSVERMEVNGFTQIIAIDQIEVPTDGQCCGITSTHDLQFKGFLQRSGHLLDLRFSEGGFLTTVLPNCYKAVKFIERSMRGNAKILVIDESGYHRCVTIVVGYIMYKHKMNFNNSYSKVKELCPCIDLDQYFAQQLYEYEKILEVQRVQARGHSCSGELRSAQLKRKRTMD